MHAASLSLSLSLSEKRLSSAIESKVLAPRHTTRTSTHERERVCEREREGSARKIAYIVGALAEEVRLFGMILSKLDGSEFIEQRLFAL